MVSKVDEILISIKRLSNELEHTPNADEIERYSEYCTEDVVDAFGSLTEAYERADLPKERRLAPTEPIDSNISISAKEVPSHTDLLKNIFLYRTELGAPTEHEIDQYDIYDAADYQAQFGSLDNAYDIAVDAIEGVHVGVEEIIEYLCSLGDHLGRKPYPYDVFVNGERPYKMRYRCGSWTAALELAGYTDTSGFHDSTDSLLSSLKSLASDHNCTQTPQLFNEKSPYESAVLVRRFGCWEAACIAAGLSCQIPMIEQEKPTPKLSVIKRPTVNTDLDEVVRCEAGIKITEYLIDDIYRLEHELCYPPRPVDIDDFSQYPVNWYIAEFGSWPSVLDAAGMNWTVHLGGIDNEIEPTNLENTLVSLAVELGRIPESVDVNCFTRFSARTYVAYYGSFDDALERSPINRDDFQSWCHTARQSQLSLDLHKEGARTPAVEHHIEESSEQRVIAAQLYSRHAEACECGAGLPQEVVDATELEENRVATDTVQYIAERIGVARRWPAASTHVPLTRQEAVEQVRQCLNHASTQLSPGDFKEKGSISQAAVKVRCGSFGRAVKAAKNRERSSQRQKYSNEEILDELYSVGSPPKQPPRLKDIDELCQFSASLVVSRFGSLGEAIRLAGYEVPDSWPARSKYTDEEILDEIQSVALEMGWRPSGADFENRSSISMTAVCNHFGTWGNALKQADVDKFDSGRYKELADDSNRSTRRELIQELQRLNDLIGESMTVGDVQSFSEYPAIDYEIEFGSIANAMQVVGVED